MTAKEALAFSKEFLSTVTDEAENESRILVSHLAEIPFSTVSFSEKTVDEAALKAALAKRADGVPIQYIIGKWWFYKGEFFVGEGVLIPRQDTETLVETALDLIKNKTAPAVCDLCSGSGCIAISIAGDRPDAAVTAVEKYDAAYSYLLKNTAHNKVTVKAVQADVTESACGSFDLIVSNPPYITAEDMKKLSVEVKREPETALFGGDDGLYFYRRITEVWRSALKADGVLAFEVGIGESDAVGELLANNGFKNIAVVNDLGGVPRVVFGTVDSI